MTVLKSPPSSFSLPLNLFSPSFPLPLLLFLSIPFPRPFLPRSSLTFPPPFPQKAARGRGRVVSSPCRRSWRNPAADLFMPLIIPKSGSRLDYVAKWTRSRAPGFMHYESIPQPGTANKAVTPSRVCKLVAVRKRWVTTAEDCEGRLCREMAGGETCAAGGAHNHTSVSSGHGCLIQVAL